MHIIAITPMDIHQYTGMHVLLCTETDVIIHRKVSQSPCDLMHASEDASPLSVEAVGTQQWYP